MPLCKLPLRPLTHNKNSKKNLLEKAIETMSRRNFHTHTYLCKHADGTVFDYCREAVAQGLDVLGFSDHTPFPDGRWSSVRMDISGVKDYLHDIEAARPHFPGLKILTGMECEYVPEYVDFFKMEFLGGYRMSYLIGAAHSYLHNGEWEGIYGKEMNKEQLHSYTDYLIDAMGCGAFSCMAHPDLFGVSYRGWDDECKACSHAIAKAAVTLDMPLEINAYGLRKKVIEDNGEWRHMYPWLPFWEIMAEYQVKVVVNSDAHKPCDVWGNTDDCLAIASKLGLNVINDTFLEKQIGEVK